MVWSAIIPAAIGAAANIWGAERQNEAAQDAASAKMAHEIGMYQNRYQWQMEDMRKAGLNPILAYKQGAPAGGAGASYSPVNVGAAGVAGAASALQMKQAYSAANQLNAAAGNQEAQAAAAKEQAKVAKHESIIRKLAVASAQAEHDRAKHEQAFWNTRTGREIAEMGAMTKALPGAGHLAFGSKLGANALEMIEDWFSGENSARSPEIVSRPRRSNVGTLTKKQKEKISRYWRESGVVARAGLPNQAPGGNWQKWMRR